MLPVNLILPEDKEELALTLHGKKQNIRRKDFLLFAQSCEIPACAAEKMIDKLCALKSKFLLSCEECYLTDEKKEKMSELISARIARLMA